jgi:hypothetical protein
MNGVIKCNPSRFRRVLRRVGQDPDQPVFVATKTFEKVQTKEIRKLKHAHFSRIKGVQERAPDFPDFLKIKAVQSSNPFSPGFLKKTCISFQACISRNWG